MLLTLLLTISLINGSPRSEKNPWTIPLSHGEKPLINKYLKENPGYWMGKKDELILKHIQISKIKSITFNRGGSTISLRLHFVDGTNAAFKPDQFHEQTVPRYEIVAYRINKLLGLSRVPPATWRILTKKEIFSKLKTKKRYVIKRILREVNFNKNGTVAGEVSMWIPKVKALLLSKLVWRRKWLSWLNPLNYLYERQYLLTAQISNMILFDFIVNNPDRFTGHNILATPNLKKIYFMDNTFAFYPNNKGTFMCRLYMQRVKKYSSRFITALKSLSSSKIKKELAKVKNPPWKLLKENELKSVMKRRDYLMKYIVKNVAKYGWLKTMVFP
jgi:hypothetical protein